VIATVLEQHGRIDALVNNAGGLQALRPATQVY
jgi:NAD(P)-dependent dehydrogenase (short-subunit alcohol dehydrogenase family)